MQLRGRICTKGIWDESVPGIQFDENGVSNYAQLFIRLCEAYPRGKRGVTDWENIVDLIREKGRGKKYNCLIGVSGGTDSSYLMHVLKSKYGLNPLAVTFDNGWSSEFAVKNIRRMTEALDIDLETIVVDYEEMKKIHLAYMKTGLPWIDTPTDFAIKNVLLQVANREKIGFVLNGHDFRSEGTQPNEWTHGDSRQFKHIIRRFGRIKVKTFPYLNYSSQIYLSAIKGIKSIKPFFFLDYHKKNAQSFLINEFGWEYYGGHHHENIFTKFTLAYWMLKKFGIDKRKITYSAQIMSGEISRDHALQEIQKPPYDKEQMESDKDYVIKKLGLTQSEFKELWESDNKTIYDYPSYLKMINRYSVILKPVVKLVFPQTPTFFYQQEQRMSK